MLLRDWRIFSAAGERDRSLKFLRAAYVWLLASLAMLILLPVYLHSLLPLLAPDSAAVQMGFSHAYYGAIRHAVTVGFISLMIVGVAAKVVPTLNGVDVRALSSLWGPFVLINAGCSLRVVSQTLTDLTPVWFPIAGVSGLLEVVGLTLWGIHLWTIMSGKSRDRRLEEELSLPGCSHLEPGVQIGPRHRIGEILDRYPRLLEVLLSFGFRPLANPILRKTIAPYVTVERACSLLNVNMQQLLDALNTAREKPAQGRMSLPVLSGK
jgi:hypothetical protein